ncbi:transcription initiation factor TFIID subunit 8-like [Paramacrobiotus metropolitanus]|uniref:transcription initiation factor TFIID subunit 8-like n=1 Tax=Paramacrobiotus metropolitanus TaxID=2943436 RepID=UPI0024463C78|nr:transcription initiation factor TFIID subunit 8-like [Paramacrobiotus metropolitanus]
MAEDISTTSIVESPVSTSLRCIIAALLNEHGIEELEDPVCVAILEQILVKVVMKLGSLTQSFAEHAMRAQAHFADSIMAVAFTGMDIPKLKSYSREFRIPKLLDGVKLTPDQAGSAVPSTLFQSGDQRRLPRYIPDYFPPMPSVYTFESTPVQKQNKIDYKQAREKLASERRQVEKSLTAYHLRIAGPLDSPFQLKDPSFALLPATYRLDKPAYIAALSPSKFENRRTEEVSRFSKETELDKSREDDELQSMKEDGPPRKYRRHNQQKKVGDKERKQKTPSKKSGPKSKERHKEETEESNSASGLFSP